MTRITSHVLDTGKGKPASGVNLVLERRLPNGQWATAGSAVTDDDGRAGQLAQEATTSGTYRLTFDTAEYFARSARESFYPEISITFEVSEGDDHYHVPLLLNAWGYTTYRGS